MVDRADYGFGWWLVASCQWPMDELFGFGWLVVERKRQQGRETVRWGRREGELYGNILLFLLGNICYFNQFYDKIKTGDNGYIVKWYGIIDKVAFIMVKLDIFKKPDANALTYFENLTVKLHVFSAFNTHVKFCVNQILFTR